MSMDELDSTLDMPVLAPHDHTLLLRAVQQHSTAIIAALGRTAKVRPLPPIAVLKAIASLAKADDKTRHTSQQVLTFLEPLGHVPLPASYAATLTSVDEALAPAGHPMAVVHALIGLREARAHDRVPGFQAGVIAALDLIGDALETAGTMMTGVSVFGRRKPADICKACAHGCVSGALAGTINKIGASVGGVVGGVAGSTQALITAVLDNP
jgi:hypothetical protein